MFLIEILSTEVIISQIYLAYLVFTLFVIIWLSTVFNSVTLLCPCCDISSWNILKLSFFNSIS